MKTKEITKSTEREIDSLKKSVIRDCEEGENCFNPNGCNKKKSKCFHKYCDKYKWIIDRAKHYAEKTGKTYKEILEIWEKDRSYWYMNYYGDFSQPLIKGENVIMYEDWEKELIKRFGKNPKNWAFVCPKCKNVQTIEDFIDFGIEEPETKFFMSCIGRWVKGKGCDWTLGGLFQVHKTTVINNGKATPVFEMAEKNYKECI